MGIRSKFVSEVADFTLQHIKRIEVKFNPLHPNAANVREFYQGVTDKKSIKSNRECILKAKVVSDQSDPEITVQFEDDHKLMINAKHLEASHFLKLLKQFKVLHKNEEPT